MALSNLNDWKNNSHTEKASACGSACGAGKPDDKPKPSACGSACGAGK